MNSNQLLADAIRKQAPEDVRAALAAGADPNGYIERSSMLGLMEGAAYPPSEMDRDPWLCILRILLESGADPNQPVDDYVGPGYLLHYFAQHAQLPAMRLMLEFGANPNLLQDGEDTALDLATGDAGYVACELGEHYQGHPLPEYPRPTEQEHDGQRTAYLLWLLSRHQEGCALLRGAGALRARELPVPTPDT